jgi:hypothetical protein
LSEALAELIERQREKEKVKVLARWEPERRVGANLSGLLIKMVRSTSLEEREDKKISVCRCWVGVGKGV